MVLTACGVAAPQLSGPAGEIVLADAGTPPDAGALPDAGTCDGPVIELTVDFDAVRGPTRVYAHAQHQGADVALLVDTGSQLTFFATDGGVDGAPDAGTIVLGGETLHLLGRPYPVDEKAGSRPVIGTLGADYFLAKNRELDLPARRLRTLCGPAAQPGWEPLRYEDLYGYLFVRVTLNGTAVRLGFDTGAAHALWLGQDGEPGDQLVSTQDAYGNPLVLSLGTASLAFDGGVSRTVPVLRTRRFPSLEDSNRQLGGDIQGLFGLTAMQERRIRIEAATSTIWLAPR